MCFAPSTKDAVGKTRLESSIPVKKLKPYLKLIVFQCQNMSYCSFGQRVAVLGDAATDLQVRAFNRDLVPLSVTQ